MSKEELTTFLKDNNLVLVNKNALLDFMIEANLKTQVDKRVLWIDRKTAIAKYGVSRAWLIAAEKDVFSLLKFKKGAGKTSPTKYNEQSVIDELNRLV